MHVRMTSLLLAGAAAVLASTYQAAAEGPNANKPDPLFTGISVPMAPQQGNPWKPPESGLPKSWATAVQTLRGHGYADPRGCEYRNVKLAFAGTTHAWVVPHGRSEKEDSPRFAVTWDGLIYPALEIGSTCDLKADVEALLADRTVPPVFGGLFGGPLRHASDCGDSDLVSHRSLLLLKCCSLYVLGEGKLADRLWTLWAKQTGTAYDSDPSVLLTEEWGWALFLRAQDAHSRGDDYITSVSAKTLLEIQKDPHAVFRSYPRLLAEEAMRRLQAKPIRRVLEVGLDKYPDRAERIAALIRDLEVAQPPEPYLNFLPSHEEMIASSPIVEALIHEGLPAVDPLIECLANDRRWTRTVQFHGKFSRQGFFMISVSHAAFAALQRIFKVDSFGPETREGYEQTTSDKRTPAEYHAAVANEIRQFFREHKGQSAEETWLAVLADPKSTDPQAMEAARRIVAPAPPRATAENQFEAGDFIDDNATEPRLPLAGEVLRIKRSPSVTEALTRRADEQAQLARLHYSDEFLSPACELTLCLAKWDAKAGVPVNHRRFADYRSVLRGAESPGGSSDDSRFGETLALLAEAGIQAGDDSIADDYAAWIRTMPEKVMEHLDDRILLPLYRHPENAKLAALARWMFLAEGSAWHPVHSLNISYFEPWYSRLLGVPAYRESLKREMNNDAIVGTFQYGTQYGAERVTFDLGHSTPSESVIYAPEGKVPDPGETPPLHLGDYYAYFLSNLEGAPRFEPYWPEKKRAAVRAEIGNYLDRWGTVYRDRHVRLDADYTKSFRPEFRLAKLDHPATAADVAGGRAIFSLGGPPDARVRVVDLKPFPHIARWKTLEKFRLREPVEIYPPEPRGKNTKGPAAPVRELFDREGLIWQAEEVSSDGRWKRYYGFVGRHIIAKVPEEEIELLEEFSEAHRP